MLAEVDIKTVKVSGEALSTFTKSLPDYLLDFAQTILVSNNIKNLKNGEWYPLEYFLNALNDLEKKFGKSILYEMGKKVVEYAILPEGIHSFADAICSIKKGFVLNHINCEVCEVKIIKMSMRRHRVVLEMENPYPFELNRGILAGISRTYSPKDDSIADVEIIDGKSNYPVGVYEITW